MPDRVLNTVQVRHFPGIPRQRVALLPLAILRRQPDVPFGCAGVVYDANYRSMKNQYFGDIHDFRKYGLLRVVIRASGLRFLIAWMLTPDDASTNGNLISYLEHPGKWSRYDPVLFRAMKKLLTRRGYRRVGLIENTGLLPKAKYFSNPVPDSASHRNVWLSLLAHRAQKSDLVFLDTGLEIKSRPYGTKGSSRFVYWREVETLWAAGKSLLIYQHFTREKRSNFIQRLLDALGNATPGSLVEAFSTSQVVFLMALQSKHRKFYSSIIDTVQENWGDQIQHQEETRAKFP